MPKWRPSKNPPDLTPKPAFGVSPHGYHHPPPPHVITYDGLAHISDQVDELRSNLAEIKALLTEIVNSAAR